MKSCVDSVASMRFAAPAPARPLLEEAERVVVEAQHPDSGAPNPTGRWVGQDAQVGLGEGDQTAIVGAGAPGALFGGRDDDAGVLRLDRRQPLHGSARHARRRTRGQRAALAGADRHDAEAAEQGGTACHGATCDTDERHGPRNHGDGALPERACADGAPAR